MTSHSHYRKYAMRCLFFFVHKFVAPSIIFIYWHFWLLKCITQILPYEWSSVSLIKIYRWNISAVEAVEIASCCYVIHSLHFIVHIRRLSTQLQFANKITFWRLWCMVNWKQNSTNQNTAASSRAAAAITSVEQIKDKTQLVFGDYCFPVA